MSPRTPGTGDVVGHFHLAEEIGGDDLIAVFRGVRPEGSREPRVVRVLVARDPADPAALDRLRRAYARLRALDDPRFPAPVGWYAGQAALATTWVEGATLAEVLRAWTRRLAPHDPATAIDLGVEVARGLRALHAIDDPELATWGNLEPDRVVLTPGGGVVLDRLGDPPGSAARGYRAPERVAGAFTDPRTDRWDLGALIVELLTGERVDGPAAGDGRGPLARIGRRWPALGEVLATLLAPAAGDRFASDDDAIDALLAAARSVPGRPDRPGLADRVDRALPRLRGTAPAPAADPADLARDDPPPPTPIPVEVVYEPDSAPAGQTLVPPEGSGPPPEEAAPAPPPAADPPADPGAIAVGGHTLVEDADLDVSLGGRSLPGVAPVEITVDPRSATGEAPVSVEVDPDARTEPVVPPAGAAGEPPPARPAPGLMRSEVAGMLLGGLFVVLGLLYLVLRVW